MRALKAVDAANGTGKAARYTEEHVNQAKRLHDLMAESGLSMPAAAARLRIDAALSRVSRASKRRLAVEACFRGSVHNLGSGVYLAVDPQARSALQSQLLKELKSRAEIIQSMMSEKRNATASEMRSRVHRTR
ncbi:hypothetical protein JKG41_15420 [Acidithiobacillus sp. MC2.1]|nr:MULTISPECIES: hypothetical protein [Pseudomonadota]MBN6746424.1 hypothetical protein [Acidithiobacillus sp. MC2.2]MDG0857488.1 hypothetical protein [Roseateles puraquae]